MPVFMDVHESLGDATAEDIAEAHRADLAIQDEYGVRWLTYWFNDVGGKAFCLMESPDPDSAVKCHKAAHGLVPHEIIEVSGESMMSFFGELNANGADRALTHDNQPDSGVRLIMFTDIVGSTAISNQRGDAAAFEAVRRHDGVVRHWLESEGGREVKHTGDGILASFLSVSAALSAAIGIQNQLADERSQDETYVSVSIGISAGEPVQDSEDLFGAAVNLSSRLCAHAGPDSILVSSTVKDLAMGKPFLFKAKGSVELKGFSDPVQVFEVATD